MPSSGGGQCRVCAWSDDPTLRCLQCFDATGARAEDSCDRVRREVLGYPMPIPMPAPMPTMPVPERASDAGVTR